MRQVFRVLIISLLAVFGFSQSSEALSIKDNEITLRIGSGHPPFITYIKQFKKVLIPRIMERAAKETKYTVKFKEHYAGQIVNVFDTLEGVQDGRLDMAGWCVCFDDDKALAPFERGVGFEEGHEGCKEIEASASGHCTRIALGKEDA